MDNNDPCAPDAARPGSAEDEPPQPASSCDDSMPGGASIQLDITDTTDSSEAAGGLDEGALAWLFEFGTLAIARAVGGCVGGMDDGGPHVVVLSVVDDEVMSGLHLSHSGVAGPTDVLTFDLRDDDSGPLDVEIVVCLDEARRRAADHGGVVERELLLYLLHGVLHCLGYDDQGAVEFARMHAREDEILLAIGVGSVFGGSTGDGEGAR